MADQVPVEINGKTLSAMVVYMAGGSGGGTVDSVVAGDRVTVDATDPANPIVSADVAAWDDITGKPATFPATVPVASATALATGRTFSLTGGATGTSAAFTGAANASIAVTLATPTSTVRGGVLQQAALDSGTATVADVISALVAAGVLAAA